MDIIELVVPPPQQQQQQQSSDEQQNQDPLDPTPPPPPQKPLKPRRGRPRSTEEGILAAAAADRYRRVRISPACGPAIVRLKHELGLRSEGDAVLWLLQQVRPDLVPPDPPHVVRAHKDRNSVNGSAPKPVCMAYLDNGTPGVGDPGGSGSFSSVKAPVRATVVQASTVFFDTPATLEKTERLIAGAAAYGSQLVVFPEAFVGGYPRCMTFDAATSSHSAQTDDLHKYFASAVEVPGPDVDRLAKIACKYRVYLVIGVVERTGYSLFSTVLFFSSMGQHLGQHRKQMLMTSESSVWHAAEKLSPTTYETSIGKIGGLICWENKLPHLRTELYTKGVEIYCAPTADARDVWKASMMHIAVEGCCFVLSANQFCRRRDYPVQPGNSEGDMPPDAITCAGGSVIVSPLGTILAGPNYHGECLISADLDLGEISLAKMEFGGAETNSVANHVSWTANGSNPVLFATDMKADDRDELSWSLGLAENASPRS